ncbi:MAG TPA: type VI secretion system needle protein Hcp [Dysgonomonas sp.]|nr:type VI secretion system needle protein Hcp [Dysgonomonas sp.]
MFGHRSFLVLGGDAADILSLVKGGLEILDCNFSFQQGIDQRGKATTKVYGGNIEIILSQLPPQEIIEWGMESRKYKNGIVVMLDSENLPVEKVLFENAACINFEVNYTQKGKSYATTRLDIRAEKLVVADGVDFDNEWTF